MTGPIVVVAVLGLISAILSITVNITTLIEVSELRAEILNDVDKRLSRFIRKLKTKP